MGSPWYKIMLGMSYYIYAGGLGALKALPGSVSKIVTPVAVIVLVILSFTEGGLLFKRR